MITRKSIKLLLLSGIVVACAIPSISFAQVKATHTQKLTLISPVTNSTYTIGQSIPISWRTVTTMDNTQVSYSVTAVDTIGSGIGGGSGQTLTKLLSGAKTGSVIYRTGDTGYLNIPGTYDVSVVVTKCNVSGCAIAPTGVAVSEVSKVRINIVKPTVQLRTTIPTPTVQPVNTIPASTIQPRTTVSAPTVLPVTTIPAPTVNLYAAQTSVNSGVSALISWSSTNAKSCSFTEGNSQFYFTDTSTSGANRSTVPLFAPQKFTVVCYGAGGTATKSISIDILSGYDDRAGGAAVLDTLNKQANSVTNVLQKGTEVALSLTGATEAAADSSSEQESVVYYSSQEVSTSYTTCVEIIKNLHRGHETASVTKLQNFLVEKGLLSTSATGFYGDKTIEAVKEYQSSKGLPKTGKVYNFTRKAIQEETCN